MPAAKPDQPITPLTMAILLSLADEDQHGYALMQEIGRQTGETPGTGSLYAALHRLTLDGLIAESPTAPGPGEDQRRRYFRITPAGRARAKREAARLLRVVEEAHEKSLLPNLGRLRTAR